MICPKILSHLYYHCSLIALHSSISSNQDFMFVIDYLCLELCILIAWNSSCSSNKSFKFIIICTLLMFGNVVALEFIHFIESRFYNCNHMHLCSWHYNNNKKDVLDVQERCILNYLQSVLTLDPSRYEQELWSWKQGLIW
jgi:hypothetical protein